MKKIIKFLIKSPEYVPLESVLEAVKTIKKSYPNAEISVEVEL